MSDAARDSPAPGELWLVRHGETEWSKDHRHTSVTDLPLTDGGVEVATGLADRIAGHSFDLVLTSPRRRARHTAELAGFPGAEVDDDHDVWNYGDYEGLTTAEIRETDPGWSVWTHPTPGGESPEQLTERLDRAIARVRAVEGPALVFGHGHSLRALTARWLGQPVEEGQHFVLGTAALSVLGDDRGTPAILKWNA